jgi:hypothetical protein
VVRHLWEQRAYDWEASHTQVATSFSSSACGYDMSGLGFYHIPHALIIPGKSDNRTTLVTVQGGVLSILQLVTELSMLIPENGYGMSLNRIIIPSYYRSHHGEICKDQWLLERLTSKNMG